MALAGGAGIYAVPQNFRVPRWVERAFMPSLRISLSLTGWSRYLCRPSEFSASLAGWSRHLCRPSEFPRPSRGGAGIYAVPQNFRVPRGVEQAFMPAVKLAEEIGFSR